MKRAAVLGAMLLAAAGSAWAETPGEDRIGQLEQRVQKLEAETGGTSRETFGSKFGENRFGLLLQLWAVHDETAGAADTVRGRRAEMTFAGNFVPGNISYGVLIDPVGLQNTNGKITQDAFVSYRLCSAAAFRFGQFKYAQGLEGRTPTQDLDFAERALIVLKYNDKRDFGFETSGDKVPVGPVSAGYAFGAVNGSGRNTPDANEDKDMVGRLGFQLTKRIWLGGQGYRGHEPTGLRDRLGGEARAIFGRFKIQGEYIHGHDEPAVPTAKPVSGDGYYVDTNYRCGCWRGGVRWESVDPNKAVPLDRTDALTFGVDFFSAKDHGKISLNYTVNFEQGTDVSNNTGILQFLIYL